MNIKVAKKLLAVTLAASMVVMPLTVGATDSSDESTEETEVTEEVFEEVEPTSVVAVGGEVIKNDRPGAFVIAKDAPIAGVAIQVTPAALKAQAGLAANETPFARVYTVRRAKSPAVYASFDAAAQALGGTVLGGLNVDLVALTAGKVSSISEGVSVPVSMAIKNYNPNLTYYVVKVLPGGKTENIPATVNEKGVLSFNVTGGLGGYGLIAK